MRKIVITPLKIDKFGSSSDIWLALASKTSTDPVGKVGTRYRYFRMTIPTVPARSGIFRYNTYDTHAYPGILGFRYLPYRQNQVFSKAIPTIPTHTPVFQDFDTYRTGKIGYFQMPYPRYPRIPRYSKISVPTVPA